MYYIIYLSSLCCRRRWTDPHYECFKYNQGYSCVVRVNQRDYVTDVGYQTEVLAKEAAAQLAYHITTNESQFAKINGSLPQTIYANGTMKYGWKVVHDN